MFLTKLANLFRNRSPRPANPTRRATLQVESLEGRDLMSASPVTTYYVDTSYTLKAAFNAGQVSVAPDGIRAIGGVLAYNQVEYTSTSHNPALETTFKGGTVVQFRPDGSVWGGTRAYTSWEWINTSHTLWETFQAGTVTGYRDDGSASGGILALGYTHHDYISTDHKYREWFTGGVDFHGAVDFRPDGSVGDGHLAYRDWEWTNPSHTTWAYFSAGTRLFFQPDGSIWSTGEV